MQLTAFGMSLETPRLAWKWGRDKKTGVCSLLVNSWKELIANVAAVAVVIWNIDSNEREKIRRKNRSILFISYVLRAPYERDRTNKITSLSFVSTRNPNALFALRVKIWQMNNFPQVNDDREFFCKKFRQSIVCATKTMSAGNTWATKTRGMCQTQY